MESHMYKIICLLIGYAIGCIQVAYMVGKAQGIDIREHGSGNAGATNVLRVLGKRPGFTVFGFDVLKAIVAYVICSLIFGGAGTFTSGAYGILPGIYGGLGAVVGHIFPFYLKFKGGKGVSCILGVILSIHLFMALTIFALGVAVVIFTKYVSAASLSMSAMLPVFLFLHNHGTEAVLVALTMTAICFYKHSGNIDRIRKGTERTLDLFASKDES